ncbi:MAG: AAA family ATPase [Alphaproteobacteria bacterium]|nr:AAA family ATPase [Alphaproteobacteria bacterium]
MKQNKQIEKDFGKVIGYESVKLVLERTLDMIRNKEKYEKLGTKLPSGILLSGTPGIGKTLLANSFIKASGLPSYLIRKNQPDGSFVNYIKKSFEDAKAHAPAIVFLDDMDKFANEDEKHCDTEEYVTIQSCIDDVKGCDVFIIATVNKMEKLPESLCRRGRFDKHIVMNAPTGKEATQIIEHYMRSKNFADDIDSEEIARVLNGESCACLETVINEAAVLAGYAGKEKIEKEDFLRAAMCVMFDAPESLEKRPNEIVRKTAYHEAGHTVVAELLEPDSVSLVSVLGHDGPTQGVTSFYQDDDIYFSSIELMKNRVRSLLAGKAATEIVYGEVDVGASNDIMRVMRVVDRFVDNYCSYGFDTHEFVPSNYTSNDFRNRKEMRIYSAVEHYYQEVKKMLIDNREFLDRLTEALVKKETLTCKDIQEIRKACKIKNNSSELDNKNIVAERNLCHNDSSSVF